MRSRYLPQPRARYRTIQNSKSRIHFSHPMRLSVIICTHNPREDYLRRTLEAFEKQTLPRDQWELQLVDNASNEALAGV